MAAKKRIVKKPARTVKKKNTRAESKGPKLKAIGDKQSKTEILQAIMDEMNADRGEKKFSRKDINDVFLTMNKMIHRHLMRRGSGEISVPELGIKIRKAKKSATKKRMGINPFTQEPLLIAAKPARNTVKITILKNLKEAVA